MSYDKTPDEAREYVKEIENAIEVAESSDAGYTRIELGDYTVSLTAEFYEGEPDDDE